VFKQRQFPGEDLRSPEEGGGQFTLITQMMSARVSKNILKAQFWIHHPDKT
jgi:hypothetical protein